jgi:hypothetical protein
MVRLQQQTAVSPKIKEKRRGVRLNSRVPVSIEWEKDGAGTVHEEAFTCVIGPFGCLLVLKQNLGVKQFIQIVNLATRKANSGVVVWKGNERADGWELGVELVQPSMDFWGLDP